MERDVYCVKRAEVLMGFLPEEDGTDTSATSNDGNTKNVSTKLHKYIYATEYGRAEWEERARINLKREIELLKKGIIPCEP